MPSQRNGWMTAASMGLLALMASGPFLLPFHLPPIPSFWSEWWAAAFGLGAVVAGIAGLRGTRVGVPVATAIPALLIVPVALQLALGRLDFPQFGLLQAAYLVWAAMLMVLGRALVQEVGLRCIADAVAAGFLLGALAGALIALAQWAGLSTGLPWMFPKFGSNVYGNLGQANHHAHYCWLGVASAIYLRERGRLGIAPLWLSVLTMIFGSVLTGSRSVFVFSVVILSASVWKDVRGEASLRAALTANAAWLLPATLGLSFLGVAMAPWIATFGGATGLPGSESAGAPISGARLFDSVSSPSARLEIFNGAWLAFLEHPWLGQGVGNYGWASFRAASLSDSGIGTVMPGEHAHNLFLHLLAENGVIATTAVTLLLASWAWGFLRQRWESEHAWCGAILGIGAVHAMLEYPFWYTYFLGPIALLVGATAGPKIFGLPQRRAAIYAALFAVAGAGALASLRSDYSTIESSVVRPLAAHDDREQAWRITMERVLRIQRESLLSPWALLVFANLNEPGRDLAEHRMLICERGIRLTPARSLVAKCAIQLALGGRGDDALQLGRQALRAYPQHRAAILDEFEKAARDSPELRPLADLAAER